MNSYTIEPYADGFVVIDQSGNRGRFGEAYAGRDGKWRDQPVGVTPFTTQQQAEEFIKTL